jgi:hypothetical protein
LRRIFSFDIDGVVADVGELAIMDRQVGSYRYAKAFDKRLQWWLGEIAHEADVYFVSSRSFQDALKETKEWLHFNAIHLADVAGVLCNVCPSDKASVVKALHATYHFDDDRQICASMPAGVGIHCWTEVKNWEEIYKRCHATPPLHISYACQQASLPFVSVGA